MPSPTLPFDSRAGSLADGLRAFAWGTRGTALTSTRVGLVDGGQVQVDTFVNEFWTARQRAAHSLHEVSYRACFKPQLPRFFIERLTNPGDVVYDPFMGRGTTALEAALHGRTPVGCDVNPLSAMLAAPRLDPPALPEVEAALDRVPFGSPIALPEDLLAFYHPDTLRDLCILRDHLQRRADRGALTRAEAWIRMVAVNRLTGHSRGFLSVYTMPPNQAVSVRTQRKLNERRGQTPPRRDVRSVLVAKSRALLRDCDAVVRARLARVAPSARFLTADAAATSGIPSGSVHLVVTSPPFLDVVDYRTDNWLRCWFCGIDASSVPVTTPRVLAEWETFVTGVFCELHRVVVSGGHVAFEVGEVRGGVLRLEESVVRTAVSAGLEPLLLVINDQQFTKTANCWGVANNRRGTNTNRIVVLRRR